MVEALLPPFLTTQISSTEDGFIADARTRLLHWAAAHGWTGIAKKLLDACPNIDVNDVGTCI